MSRTICAAAFLLFGFGLISTACSPVAGKPSIILAAPPHGSEFREGDNVVVQSASGDAAGIARVELTVDGTLVRTDSAPSPQTYFNVVQNWKATPGKHTLAVCAYNTAGVASEAASVVIAVSPAVTPIVATTSPRAALALWEELRALGAEWARKLLAELGQEP